MNATQKEKKCKDRIEKEWKGTKELIEEILGAEDQIEKLNETVLSWDKNHHEGFDDMDPCDSLCFSYGGPADYVRFYHDGRISYVFHDWFDGAEKFLIGDDKKLCQRLHDECLDF